MRRNRHKAAIKAWFASLVAAGNDPTGRVYLAMRQDTLHHPPVSCVTRKCGGCKKLVWVDTRLVHLADKAEAIACNVCVEKTKGMPIENVIIDELNRFSKEEL